MSAKATITVYRPREEVQRRWREPQHHPEHIDDGAVRFLDAPGDRGTEIHVDLERGMEGGKLAQLAGKLTGSDPRAKAYDALRRFKQHVETGVTARSDAVPEGELIQRKLKQRPAQPLADSELEKAGV